MMVATRLSLAITVLIVPSTFCQNVKTYKHASDYQIAVLDQNLRVATGSDLTLAKTSTDAKLGAGGQGIHLLHTDSGDYRVEAPINKGITILAAAVESNAHRQANTFHNKWFLDNVQPGTRVLFAAKCAQPSKKHPHDAVRCVFYFPDPDSADHEYATMGDFTPFMIGDGSNTAKTAGVLCNTGKLKPEVEAELCLPQQESQAPAPPVTAAIASAPPPASPMTAPSVGLVGNRKPLLVGASAARPRPAPMTAAPAAVAHEASTPDFAADPSATLSVAVDSNVKGADIVVDGQFVGNTPSTITVQPGQHIIEVSKNGYATWDRALSVSGNGAHVNAELSAQAKAATTRSPRSHSLQIRCYPASACGNADTSFAR